VALSGPVLTGPGQGRTVTYGSGSTAELKAAGEQNGGGWGVVDWHVRAGVQAGSYAALPKGVPHGLKVNGDAAHLLVAVLPAGFEHYLVPEADSDADPEKYGLQINGPVPGSN